jgi:hypothetical protein
MANAPYFDTTGFLTGGFVCAKEASVVIKNGKNKIDVFI